MEVGDGGLGAKHGQGDGNDDGSDNGLDSDVDYDENDCAGGDNDLMTMVMTMAMAMVATMVMTMESDCARFRWRAPRPSLQSPPRAHPWRGRQARQAPPTPAASARPRSPMLMTTAVMATMTMTILSIYLPNYITDYLSIYRSVDRSIC